MPRLGTVLICTMAMTLCALLGAEAFDHVLFDSRGGKPAEGWWLNIWGKNANGAKGSGGIKVVPGRRGGKALRLHTTDAGRHNFVTPEMEEGLWRERQYRAIAVWYRGDGSRTKKGFQLHTRTDDGKKTSSYSGNLYLGSTEWRRVVIRSFWRRQGTPDLDLSKLWRIHIGGSGTHEITIGEIRLMAAGKPVHLTPVGVPQRASASVTLNEIELTTVRDGLHLCRLIVDSNRPRPIALSVGVAIAVSRSPARHITTVEAEVASQGTTTLNIPLAFGAERDGKHRLKLTVQDAEGAALAQTDREFHLLRRAEPEYTDIVLWPPPQVWQLGEGHWPLPERPTLSVTGQGDAFPSEHLVDRLTRVYGVEVQRVAAPSADLRIEYAKGDVKPEGFRLDVDAGGVRLRACDARGMYYGVRALLDAMCQSSLVETEARCRALHCEDWPACPTRVVYHRMDDYYQVSRGAQTYQDFIYDQVAGGRYNLLILNCRGGVRYESHPELARRSAFTKTELREIIDFARKHYVDVAPGGNSPGHASWVAIKHDQLREDGDRKTLCTRHPDALPLLREVYGELIDLFQPSQYFHLGGDEVRWRTATLPPEKHCHRCRGLEKRDLLLEHWIALIELCKAKGVKPILWEDMLSPSWNGGEPYETARILAKLPKGTIIASWGTGELVNQTKLYRDLGLIPWKVNTSYAPMKMESFLSWWKDYDALGIAEFMPWPWCNFIHYYGEKILNYTTPAVHCCAACNWKPEIAALSWHELVAAHGPHWMKVMQPTEWGTRRLRYQPISIASACNGSTLDEQGGDGKGGLDLGSLPEGPVVVGASPFERPPRPTDCVILRGEGRSKPIEIGQRVRGFVFLHTSAASKDDVAKLTKRFFKKNTSHYGMPVASYRVRYADGKELAVPVKLGWNIHFWDCYPAARIMPGARAFWTSNDACAWTMEWKNPRPDQPVDAVTFSAVGTEATVALLGITAVE